MNLVVRELKHKARSISQLRRPSRRIAPWRTLKDESTG